MRPRSLSELEIEARLPVGGCDRGPVPRYGDRCADAGASVQPSQLRQTRIRLILLLAILVPAGARAQTMLSARAVADSMLVLLLNDGQEIAIRNRSDSPSLIPRLYAVPREGACVDGTHMVCTHRYFLAVSGDGEMPPQALFDLGEVGQVTGARMMAGDADHPLLRVVVVNHPPHVFRYEPGLTREQRVYLIHLALDSLRITPEQ